MSFSFTLIKKNGNENKSQCYVELWFMNTQRPSIISKKTIYEYKYEAQKIQKRKNEIEKESLDGEDIQTMF